MKFGYGVVLVLAGGLGGGQVWAQCAAPSGSVAYNQCIQNYQTQQLTLQQQQAANAAPAPPPAAQSFMDMMASRAAAQMKKGWGAIAATADLRTIGVSSHRGSQRKAEAQAVKDCGPDCQLLASVNNGCIALALNSDRLFAVGTGKGQLDASRLALGECAAKSPDKVCSLYTEPLCAGVGGEIDVPSDLSPEELARTFEAAADPRPYWGAIGRKAGKAYTVANALSQAQAEAALKKECGAGCEVLTTHSNSCAAVAWPAGKGKPFVVEHSTYPEIARISALSKCRSDGSGTCSASAPNCTGRAYFAYAHDRVHTGAPMADNPRSRQAGSARLEPWVGHSEVEFRESWGKPDSDQYERLQYHLGYTNHAGEHRTCTVNVFLRQGAVFSYLNEGPACGDLLQ